MNTQTPITFNLTLTGQITMNAKDFEQIFQGFQIQPPIQNPQLPEQIEKMPRRLAYTTKETAELLGASPKTVYRLIERGLLKSSSALRHKRISRAEIERFLKDTCSAM